MTLLTTAFLSFLFVLNSPSTGEVKGSAQIVPWSSYRIETGESSIICNGESLYIIDAASKEIYIQQAQPMDSAQFPDISNIKGTYDGQYTDPSSQQVFTYTLSEIRSGECSDSLLFSVDLSAYSEPWIITDLR